jgi:hypothetical protein
MTPEQALAFVLFSVAAAGPPGPGHAMLTAVGANVGVLRGLPALLGVLVTLDAKEPLTRPMQPSPFQQQASGPKLAAARQPHCARNTTKRRAFQISRDLAAGS